MKKFKVSEKNDYTLIEEIKGKKRITENLEILYGRYYRLIKKHSNILLSNFRFYDNSEVKKDFEQDCFIAMLDSISAVDLKKIKHFKDDWLFIKYFWFYIKNLKKKYICDRVNKKSYSLEVTEENKPIIYYHNFKETHNEIYDFIEKSNIISITQKSIFKYRCDGYTINEIKDKMRISYGLVHLHIFKLSEIVRNNFKYLTN